MPLWIYWIIQNAKSIDNFSIVHSIFFDGEKKERKFDLLHILFAFHFIKLKYIEYEIYPKWNLDGSLQRKKTETNLMQISIKTLCLSSVFFLSNTINSYLDMLLKEANIDHTHTQTLSTTYLSGSLSTAVLLNSIQAL